MTDNDVLEIIKTRFEALRDVQRHRQNLVDSLKEILELLEYEYSQGDGIPEDAYLKYKNACRVVCRKPIFNKEIK